MAGRCGRTGRVEGLWGREGVPGGLGDVLPAAGVGLLGANKRLGGSRAGEGRSCTQFPCLFVLPDLSIFTLWE